MQYGDTLVPGEAIFRIRDSNGPDSSMFLVRTYYTNGKQKDLTFPKLRTASGSSILYLGKIYSQRGTAEMTCKLLRRQIVAFDWAMW